MSQVQNGTFEGCLELLENVGMLSSHFLVDLTFDFCCDLMGELLSSLPLPSLHSSVINI